MVVCGYGRIFRLRVRFARRLTLDAHAAGLDDARQHLCHPSHIAGVRAVCHAGLLHPLSCSHFHTTLERWDRPNFLCQHRALRRPLPPQRPSLGMVTATAMKKMQMGTLYPLPRLKTLQPLPQVELSISPNRVGSTSHLWPRRERPSPAKRKRRLIRT